MSAYFEYPCQAFHDGLPSGRAPGRLYVHPDKVEFVVGDNTGDLSLQGLQVRLGGASKRLVFLTHPIWRGWSFYTSERSFLKNPILLDHPALQHQLERARGKRRVNQLITLLVLAALLITPLWLLTRLDLATAWIAEQVPARWEATLGEVAFEQYRAEHLLLEREVTEPLMQPLTEPLNDAVVRARHPFRFYIAANPEPNAFALPGGWVVVNSGLIEHADSAEELLGVLSHEMAHVTQQHGLRNLIGGAGLYLMAGALLGDASGAFGVGARLAPYLINQSYSRKFETEADIHGYNLLMRADVDPAGLSRFFEKLAIKEQKARGEADERDRHLQQLLAYLNTHPTNQSRIERLQALSQPSEQREFRDLSDEFATLKDALDDLPRPVNQLGEAP